MVDKNSQEALKRIYDDALPRLLSKLSGISCEKPQHVVVRLSGVEEDFWDSYKDALQYASKRYHLNSFLIMPVPQEVHTFSRDIKSP
jgi:hypothetical protein